MHWSSAAKASYLVLKTGKCYEAFNLGLFFHSIALQMFPSQRGRKVNSALTLTPLSRLSCNNDMPLGRLFTKLSLSE
jgi:hypothetical protein